MFSLFMLRGVATRFVATALTILLAFGMAHAKTLAVIHVEAEAGQLSGVVTVATSPTGFSGTGYVTGFTNSDADNVSMTFTTAAAGSYQLSVGYILPYGTKLGNITVNGVKTAINFPTTAGATSFGAADGGTVQLPAGQNTIVIGGNYGYYGIDYVQLTPAAATPTVVHIEAEDATLVGTNTVRTDVAGASGTGYAGNFSQAGDSVVFKFPSLLARYTLVVRYTSPSADKNTVLVFNGVVRRLLLPKTTTGFASVTVGTYTLPAGTNRVAFETGDGSYGLDYIELTPAAITPIALANGRLEAEAGQLSGVTVSTSPTGFSGTGYVTGFTNDDAKNVFMAFNNPTAGLYRLTVGYTSPYGPKTANVGVNDSKLTVSFSTTTSFGTADAGTVLLPAGLNSITIGGNNGYYGIDYVQLTPVATPDPPVKPSKQLSDPLATGKTQALFNYLVDQYGSKVLAAQQDDNYGTANSEVAYLLATTGKEPAIVAMDLYDYSSAYVAAYGTPTGETERFLTWSSSGNGRGITSLIWHWRAPADLYTPNSPGGAFYTANSSFDFKAALADPSGTRYQLLLQDIDLIAAQLKKFQDANVPILWRPLHETPGTYFWWGSKGPDAFKELWKLLYTRLTVYHQLHNLIWVYSVNDLPDAAWYPGDDYVDITGVDIYQANSEINPNANVTRNWDAMQALAAPRKMVAANEVGSLVNPTQVQGYANWWSWFGGWQGYYIRSQPKGFLRQLYNDDRIITKDELPALTAPLPVVLTAFTVQALPNRDAQLSWHTASETSSAFFDIERSFDGDRFVKVGQVAAQGTTNAAHTYAFTDAGIGARAQGPIYYRLRQVDLSGTATYSPTRTVDFGFGPAGLLALYPNPAVKEHTNLDLSSLPANATYQVRLLDATGRSTRQWTLAGGQPQPLDVADLPAGTYFVMVSGTYADGSPLRQVLHLTQP